MSENIRISLFEIVGSPFCVASDDGQKVHDRLADVLLKQNREVVLSFRNITALTAAFLNTAMGQLYGTFSEKRRSLLKVEDAEQDDLALLKQHR